MLEFLQPILSGIAAGTNYALIALAMVIIYKTSEVLNFAQGEMGLICAFAAYVLLDGHNLPPLTAFFGALVFSVLVGLFIEFCFLRRAKEPTVLGLILITLGSEMILMGLVSWKFAGQDTSLPFLLPEMPNFLVESGDQLLTFSGSDLTALIVGLGVMGLLVLFFRTKIGVAMKATQQNLNAARIMGVRTDRIMSVTWAMSSVIGALAAMFIAPQSLDKGMMMDPMLHGFAAAVLGGMTSLVGAVVGAYIVGVVEKLVVYLLDVLGAAAGVTIQATKWEPLVPFAIIVLILCFKPSGLFVHHYVKKV